ncbi:MAG: pyridoxal-phosphate dependent enzyme [Actinomycetes bacterium]
MEQNLPTLADVQAAQELITGIARRTPMRDARWLSDATGGSVVLKCENLQRAGSFKIRGAYTRIARLSDEEKAAGVVAASAGNHAQGVALAARSLGVKATVFMPVGATLPKVTATRDYGADVVLKGVTIDESLAHARAFSESTGAVLVHPFDHADIVAGQGTCGLEIMQDCPDVNTIVVCMGGGGLAAGVAMATGQGGSIVAALGAASGIASAVGVGRSTASAVGAAAGVAVAIGRGPDLIAARFAFPGDPANGGKLAISRRGGRIVR